MRTADLAAERIARTEDPNRDVFEDALARGQDYLLSLQQSDGHWCAELEGDTILESEYILALHFLGLAGSSKVKKAAEYLRRKQLPEGGWAIYEGGPADASSTVKAYFVLKLLGDEPSAPHMARARRMALELGGIEACNSFTKIYLAVFGQYEWSRCPAVPPELILLPRWFPFNIYKMSSWSRTIVVPLSIIWAHRPFCPVPPSASIDELHISARRADGIARPLRERLWRSFFRNVDRALKTAESLRIRPLRRRALAKAEAWIHERLVGSGGLGAIFPPIINTLLAFRCLGYAPDDPRILGQLKELERLEIEDEDTLRVQPCFSAVWDTAMAISALVESGLPADHPALCRAAGWLLDREVRRPGDWTIWAPDTEPSGWFFEYENAFYPDTDDTGEVLTALSRVKFPDIENEQRRLSAVHRAMAWLAAMQNSDGGWGAFDRGCDNEVFTFIPFADHNAMIDPSCEDITGRIIEGMLRNGVPASDPVVARARRYLLGRQHSDGTWYGRWGVNYIYGTWLAVAGLARAGEDLRHPRFRKAAAWLVSRMNEDGGWGELPTTYDEPSIKGRGPSTPSQTGWALLTLAALGDRDALVWPRALAYLCAEQKPDGSWFDAFWTGTGFPRVFYLRYHLYATLFPIRAIAAALAADRHDDVRSERQR